MYVRPTTMRISPTKILRLLFVGVLTAPLWLSTAGATSCAPPAISLADFVVRPGDEVEVRGRSWSDGCGDSGASSPCSGDNPEPGEPIKEIRLMLEKKGSKEQTFLTEVDAGPGFGFRTEIVIPDVEPGFYRIVDAAGMSNFEPGTFRIRRPSSG